MAQGKHDGKPGKRRALLIVEIICVIVVIVCVALIFMQVSKYWTANNEFNAITEEYDRNPNALVTDNPNCVGWVSVADTRIDYPVMYTPNDPEYYLIATSRATNPPPARRFWARAACSMATAPSSTATT